MRKQQCRIEIGGDVIRSRSESGSGSRGFEEMGGARVGKMLETIIAAGEKAGTFGLSRDEWLSWECAAQSGGAAGSA